MPSHYRYAALGAIFAFLLYGLLSTVKTLDFSILLSNSAGNADIHSFQQNFPSFVDHHVATQAQASTSLGYECFDAFPRRFQRASKEIVALLEFKPQVEEIKVLGVFACLDQVQLSLDVLNTVERCDFASFTTSFSAVC